MRPADDTLIDEERQYIQRTAADGSFDQAGTDTGLYRGQCKQDASLHGTSEREAGYGVPVCKRAGNRYALRVRGRGAAEIREVYNNFTDEARTFMTLLVFYKAGSCFALSRIKPSFHRWKTTARAIFLYARPDGLRRRDVRYDDYGYGKLCQCAEIGGTWKERKNEEIHSGMFDILLVIPPAPAGVLLCRSYRDGNQYFYGRAG